jgi:DNA-binding NtrC family response regulator
MGVFKMNITASILVIDDEEVVRHSYLRTLSSAHCNVRAVSGGKDALHLMAEQVFDVVLLDLSMPGMDGITVLKAIKGSWPESEVIIVTGYPEIESAKAAVALGAYGYLAKPVGPDEVINAANGAMLHKKWALRYDKRAQCPDAWAHGRRHQIELGSWQYCRLGLFDEGEMS